MPRYLTSLKAHAGRIVFVISAFLDFVVDGLRPLIPSPLRRRAPFTAWRWEETVGADDGVMVSRNMWGERQTPENAATDDIVNCPHILAKIPTAFIHSTVIDFPTAARRRLMRAVATRLDELSPIPLEDAVVSSRILGVRNRRLYVNVAITRRSTIDTLEENAPQWTKSFTVVSASDAKDNHVLEKRRKPIKLRMATVKPAHAVFACAALVLLGSFFLRLDRVEDQLKDNRNTLVAALKNSQSVAAALDHTEPAFQAMEKEKTLASFLMDLDALAAAAPLKARLSSIHIDATGAVGDGHLALSSNEWTPETWRSFANTQPSNRPGFDAMNVRFERLSTSAAISENEEAAHEAQSD
ncbi:MAG: hypothetical protein AAGA09_09120 [Pseudomonadota bacterium]